MRIFYAILLFCTAAVADAAAADSAPEPPAAPPGTRLLLAPDDTAPRILSEQTVETPVPVKNTIADPLLRMRRPAGNAGASRVGAVTIGDLTLIRGADGRTTTLTQSGNLLIRQDAAGSSFTRVQDAERPPVFLRDSRGRVTGPMSAVPGSESPKSTMPSRPATLPSPQRDTPSRTVAKPERNSFSSMPSRPKTLPPPKRENPAGNLPRPVRNSFSSMPSHPGTLPAPGRGR